MAGAGYKLFNTGDVLTAAQVNTYLMEQSVMVFANAGARTTALSGVVAEGMLSYLKDTDAVEVYNGSAWVASDDPNAIQNTIVDAKGDLIAASANDTPARLAVGNNGETLLADSAATTGLRWQGNYAAGKNKIINGDFFINQRAFSSNTTSGVYLFDRFSASNVGGTVTYTAQTFTLGTAPVTGYEAKNFIDVATTGQSAAGDFARLVQSIESVRTLANQAVTVSFWAKAASGTPKVAVEIQQVFGTGGSPSSAVNTYFGQATLSTSWARYSVTANLPSISGKTLGTANDDRLQVNLYTSAGTTFDSRTGSLGTQTATISFWGVQVEAGSVATAFQTATGTLAGELAACQRYYYRINFEGTASYGPMGVGYSANNILVHIPMKVSMRVAPTAVDYASLRVQDAVNAATTVSSVGLDQCAKDSVAVYLVASSITQYRPYFIYSNTLSSYIGFTAEL